MEWVENAETQSLLSIAIMKCKSQNLSSWARQQQGRLPWDTPSQTQCFILNFQSFLYYDFFILCCSPLIMLTTSWRNQNQHLYLTAKNHHRFTSLKQHTFYNSQFHGQKYRLAQLNISSQVSQDQYNGVGVGLLDSHKENLGEIRFQAA